jgi:HlyD family secretion protein
MAVDAHPTTSATAPTPVRTPEPPPSASARERLDALFTPSTPRSWLERRRTTIAVAAAVVLVASVVLATQAFGAGEAGYRTATVGRHDVDARQTGVATIEPVAQASVAFPAAGTVATVPVKVGDRVAAGQTLATLDPASLERTVREKEAARAQAELTLERALNGEDVGGTGSRPSSDGSDSATPMALTTGDAAFPIQLVAATTPAPGPTSGGRGSLRDAQQAVLDAQRAVDGALHTAAAESDAAANVCAAAGVGGDGATTPTPEALAACQTAMRDVAGAQQAVSVAQQQLASASEALDAILEQTAAAGSGANPGGNGATGGDGSAPSGGSGATSPSSGANPPSGSSSPTSADLASFQQAVDAAEAQVAVAQQAVGQATIVSPIAGTVQAVNLAVGDTVSAASTTANVLVVGPDGFEATTTVSVDDIASVKVGQPATVVPDGSKRALAGTVTSVSVAPVDTSSTPVYRVVIGLADPHADLDNGATATSAIVTQQARHTLAVPTSAVTTAGGRHFVTIRDGTETSRVAVTAGVVGDRWTEIRSGVRAGQQVVLADLSEPLPGSATESSVNGNGNGQPLGGGGFGPPGGATFRFGGR